MKLHPFVCTAIALAVLAFSGERLPEKSGAEEPRVSSPLDLTGFEASLPSPTNDLREVQRQYNDKIRPLLKQYCGNCHWGPDSDADFNLEGYETLDQLLNGRKKWKKVVVRVAAKEMPPEDATPLPDDDHKAVLQWIDNLLDSVDCTDINPGRVTIRRLNRTEYKNTIRDLMGVNYEPANDFPGDDVGYGFDNIGDVLSLPPILMEKYLQAAEEITAMAIVDPSKPAFKKSVMGNQFKKGNNTHSEDQFHVLSSDATVTLAMKVPDSGKYEVQVRAFGDQAGDEPVRMSFGANGRTFGKRKVMATDEKHEDFSFEGRLRRGENQLEVSFLNDFYEKEVGDRNLHLVHVVVKGPFGRLPKTHKNLVPKLPTDPANEKAVARKTLNTFMSRAYRRRASSNELSRLMGLYNQARDDGEGFEMSLRFAFQAVLVSPYFLFKIEAPAAPGKNRKLTDFELATNLSYFLWSTMPDSELLRLATQKKLSDPHVYRQQIKRMMKDPKSGALVENFVAQWLQLRHLEQFQPDPDMFPGIDSAMKQDMVTETKMMFADLIKRDANVLEILATENTFINERLAKHYGIDDVKGEHFRKISMAKHGRGGLLTHASILTLTSNPTRTSPVKRGKWIMENLLGEEPPPPDPEAMQLEDQAELKGTLRQRMEQHRANPACAVCHKVMDQLGFALENYDAVGKWRDVEMTNTIDATGELPDGTVFHGAAELQETVREKMKDQFVRCLTEKMLIYGLGRGLEYFDECTLDRIISQIESKDYRFSELIFAIATSDPFVQRQGKPNAVDEE